MKYEVTLKRRPTPSPVQNMRRMRVEVNAATSEHAKEIALAMNHNGKYFLVESVRRA